MKVLENVDLNNLAHVLGLVLCLIVVMTSYVKPFFATNLEVLLMQRGEEKKREVATFVVLYTMFAIANCFFVSDDSLVSFEIIALLVMGSIWILIKIVLGIMKFVQVIRRKRKKGAAESKYEEKRIHGRIKKFLPRQEYATIIVLPIFVYGISLLTGINKYSLTLLATLAEVFVLILVMGAFGPKKSHIAIKKQDGSETLYVYRKINKEYLLCGDSNLMETSDRIITIPITDIFHQEYYLVMIRKVDSE